MFSDYYPEFLEKKSGSLVTILSICFACLHFPGPSLRTCSMAHGNPLLAVFQSHKRSYPEQVPNDEFGEREAGFGRAVGR